MSADLAHLTVGEIMRRWPATGDVLGTHGIDLCCGVGLPLDKAALAASANLDQLVSELEAHMNNNEEDSTMSQPVEVDVRVLPPPQKHPTIFTTFNNLASGESMILINDHDPKPLYYQMNAEMSGQFEWEYLEKGPVWKVQIRKS